MSLGAHLGIKILFSYRKLGLWHIFDFALIPGQTVRLRPCSRNTSNHRCQTRASHPKGRILSAWTIPDRCLSNLFSKTSQVGAPTPSRGDLCSRLVTLPVTPLTPGCHPSGRGGELVKLTRENSRRGCWIEEKGRREPRELCNRSGGRAGNEARLPGLRELFLRKQGSP